MQSPSPSAPLTPAETRAPSLPGGLCAAVAAGLLLAGAGMAAAQALATGGVSPEVGEDAPPVFTAVISQGLTVDSNYDLDPDSPGTSTYADTLFGFAYSRATETQNFNFGLDTGLRALWEADEDFEFTLASPTGGQIGYGIETAGTAFDAELRYRQRRTDFSRDLGDFVTDEGVLPDNLNDLQDDTREMRYDAELGLDLATDAPSSYSLAFTGTRIDYSDEEEGRFTPRQTALIEGSWSLRVNPILSTIVGVGYYIYDADNEVETETEVREIDAGLVWQPDENVRVRGGLGYADRTRSQLDADGDRFNVDDNSGATLRGDFVFVQENWNLYGDGRVTTAAPQTRFSFSVNGTYRLNRGSVTGRVFNRYTNGDDGDSEVRVSGIGFGVVRDINSLSRVNFDFAVARETDIEDEEADDGDDDTTASASISYGYDITPVIATEVGYGYRHERDDGADADSHRVFLSISRSFSTGVSGL